MNRILFVLFLLFSNFFIHQSKSEDISSSFTEITFRPYIGIGYTITGNINKEFAGVDYKSILPNVFNGFGGYFGLSANYFMLEFSGFYNIPMHGGGNYTYGITSSTMDLATLRLTAIAKLHFELTGHENNFLILAGLIHSFGSISYQKSGTLTQYSDLHRALFGTHIEVGIGYMRDITEHISFRTDLRYSPISLLGATEHSIVFSLGFFGFW